MLPLSPRPRLSRRRLLTATALAAGLAAVLTACGGSSGATDARPADQASSPSTGQFPATVEHRYGTTTVPAQPQRIVTVGLMEQDAVLALGQVPVATTEWFGKRPGAIFEWATDKVAGRPLPQVLTNADGLQFEKIAALKPDLILGIYSALTSEDYAKLAKIAPTIAQPKGQKDWTASWQEITRMTGAALGRPADADKLVADGEAKLAAVRAAHPEFAGRTAVVAGLYQGVFAYGSADARGRLVTSLGFTVPAEIDKLTGTGYGGTISNERLDLIDTDVAIWLMSDYAAESKQVAGNPVYPTLDVAKQGRDVFVAESKEPAYYAATSFITVLSLPHLLDTLVPQLVAATDGDPATVVPGVGSKAADGVRLAGVGGGATPSS